MIRDEEESGCMRAHREPGKVKAGGDSAAGMASERPR